MSASHRKHSRHVASSTSEDYCPTPDEIAAACLAIRAEWSEEERLLRRVGISGFARLHAQVLADVMPLGAKRGPASATAVAAGRHSRS